MTRRFNAFTLAEGATHVVTSHNTCKNAFTLAEVLITLGIIGVVAAMTMPTLINSTQGAQYKAAYKKALSAISQAVTLNVALDDWDFSNLTTKTQGSGETATTVEGDFSVTKLLKERMNVVDTKTGALSTVYGVANSGVTAIKNTTDADVTSLPTTDKMAYFTDGIMFAYNSTSTECTKDTPCYGVIDVNGNKGPNSVVTCSGTLEALTQTEQAEVDAATGFKDYNKSCTEVKNPTDIYPVKYYDKTILPASGAARAVLYGK